MICDAVPRSVEALRIEMVNWLPKMLPRLLIIDDLFGRNVAGGRNADRENLCAHFLWQDATNDAAARATRQKVLKPVAEAVFFRGQSPSTSGIGTVVENDLEGSLSKVREGWSNALGEGRLPWAMLLLDLCFYTGPVTRESDRRTKGMPEGRARDDNPQAYFGMTLLDTIHREFPELPVFILSSKPREEVNLEFVRRGALGFIDRSDLRAPELLESALWSHGLVPDSEGEIVGNSLPVLLALREARRVAGHGENVLIRGERGTGKELMARYLHRVASRDKSTRPFVVVNSAVFTQNLFSSELFGIQPRTATGVDGKTGMIESAKGGDLFLDEIADMPPEVQAAMLRVLQDRKIIKVGGRQVIPVDVRFLSATNVQIEDDPHLFRRDLLDRLRRNGMVWLPPLRERLTDIPLLVEKFVRDAEATRPGTRRREVTPDALSALKAYQWPGNVREMQSVILAAVSRYPDVEYLVASHLSLNVAKTAINGAHSHEGEYKITSDRVDLSHLLRQIEKVTFDSTNTEAWAGKLDILQRETTRLISRMLQVALDATKYKTPKLPKGQIQIHPAVKLLTGNDALTASKAADVIKRLLGPLEQELEGDLLEAYQKAIKLRPKSLLVRAGTQQTSPDME